MTGGMTAAMVAIGSAAIISVHAPAVVAAHGVQSAERPLPRDAEAGEAQLR